jgi:cobalt-zinc-cadmium efflux system protein
MPAYAHDQPKPMTGAAALAARRDSNRQRMRVALAINAAMLALALAGGLVFDSLALLADAGHVLSDFGAIALGLLAAGLAARGGAPRRTFGLHRGEVLAALVNGIGLVAIAVLVAIAAIGRLQDPPEIEGVGVLVVGLFGLAGNAWATWVLARGERSDLNLEAVLRHSAADALGSLAVVVSAVAIMAFSWHEADPVAGLAIAALILASSVRLVRDPLEVLMESAPMGLDVDELGTRLCAVEGVSAIHELHVWTVTSGFDALAAHVVTAAGVDRDGVRRELELLLRDAYGIEHTTLQMEEPGDEDALLQVRLQDS